MTLTADELRKAILAEDDLVSEVVEVPEWKKVLRVRVATMSGTQRDAFEASIISAGGKPDMANMRAKLAAACIVTDAGTAVFKATDIASLGAKNSVALERVVRVAQRLNRLGDTQLEELKGN